MLSESNINYIVSGLERSGTSMLMQILKSGGLPISFDDARRPDENNPRGYYELEEGKIINVLMENKFPFQKYQGKFIKITCYGLKFLPTGKYKIIYSERNIEEILDSMEQMTGKKDTKRADTKTVFLKLNNTIKQLITNRSDIDVLFVNYNDILADPELSIKKIVKFLNLTDPSIEKMIEVIDNKLYRQRRKITN